MKMRRQNFIEKGFTSGYTSVQLALKLKNPKDVNLILKKLNDSVVGLHTKFCDGQLITDYNSDPTPVYPLPHLESLEKCCYYTAKQHMRPVSQALGSLAANEDTIVLNLNHAAGDGGYMRRLFNALRDNKSIGKPPMMRDIEVELSDELNQFTELPYFLLANPHLTRIKPNDKEMLTLSHNTTTQFQSDAKKLQIYNKETGHLSGLTDSMIVNQILAASAMNGTFDKKGINVNVDIRPFMKNIDFGLTNAYSCVYVLCDDVTLDTTVREFMKKARKSLLEKIQRKEFFAYLETQRRFSLSNIPQEIAIDYSNAGHFNVGGPFDDAWICVTRANSSVKPQVNFFSFSVSKGDSNVIYSRLRHSRFNFSVNESKLFGSSVHYGLENIKLDATCAEALEMMRDYQKSFRKTLIKPNYI